MMQLALLQPGVSPAESFNAKDKGLLGLGSLAVSGNATTANLFTSTPTFTGANDPGLTKNRASRSSRGDRSW